MKERIMSKSKEVFTWLLAGLAIILGAILASEIFKSGKNYYECPNCKYQNLEWGTEHCPNCNIKLVWQSKK